MARRSAREERAVVVYRGRNVTVKYKFAPHGFAACALGPQLRRAVGDVAQNRAKPYAIAISPHHSGQYRSSFKVFNDAFATPPARNRFGPMRRVAAHLVNTSTHALIVEVGAKSTPPYRVLGKTLAHLGGH